MSGPQRSWSLGKIRQLPDGAASGHWRSLGTRTPVFSVRARPPLAAIRKHIASAIRADADLSGAALKGGATLSINGFYSLGGALRYFCEDGIDTAQKKEMRDRIVQGPPFGSKERGPIQVYNEEDTRSLVCLVRHIVPTIRSLPHAMMRANFQWVTAQQERRGVPLDWPLLSRIRSQWTAIQRDLVVEMDAPFGVYEFEGGKPHWRKQRFANLVRRNGWSWPTYADGSLNETDQTFRDMAGRYRQVEPLRELRYSMSKLRLNDLAVGNDGRNRTLLGAYGTKTGRNAPSNSQFVFGPAKWLRFLITPPPGRVLIHRDYCQQEVRIAAVESGDDALLRACKSGDVYLGIAQQLGFVREGMTPARARGGARPVQDGRARNPIRSRPALTGDRVPVSRCSRPARYLRDCGSRFRVFETWAACAADHAGLRLEINTPFGWVMQCPPGINPRTVRNFPIQATAAEILHVACILAERRGIEIVAPVHDAIMAETPLDQAEEASAALDRVMRDASVVVLRGYELPTDVQIVRPGQHFFDKRGLEMWETITRLVTKLEERRA